MKELGDLVGPIFALAGVILALLGSSVSVIESTSTENFNSTSVVTFTNISSFAVVPYSVGFALFLCLLSIFNTPSNYKGDKISTEIIVC